MNTMIDKVDKTYRGDDLLSIMRVNYSPGACLGLGLCGCSQGVHYLRASTQSHCYQPPPPSKLGSLQDLLDIIDEAILLVSDCGGEDATHRSVDSSDETKAHTTSEQDEHPDGADANARHGSSSTP